MIDDRHYQAPLWVPVVAKAYQHSLYCILLVGKFKGTVMADWMLCSEEVKELSRWEPRSR